MKIQPQLYLLSCKIDSLYYALQYYCDTLPDKKEFYSLIPVKETGIFGINNNGYVITNPLNNCVGGLNAQQARFNSKWDLTVLHDKRLRPVTYKNGLLDTKKVHMDYGKKIGFGIDTRLLLKSYDKFLKDNQIVIKKFCLKRPDQEQMAALFIKELLRGRVVYCNGIVHGFKYPRVFTFTIMGTDEEYQWKEASHTFVIIGYDLKNKVFIIADNYGYKDRPYQPAFREITFERLYFEITLLDNKSLDYSFSLGRMD